MQTKRRKPREKSEKPASSVPSKLKRFFESSGMTQQWFAKETGMHRNMIYMIIQENRRIPQKHWKKVIIYTQGAITLKDLMQECLSDVDDLRFKSDDFDSCEVSINL